MFVQRLANQIQDSSSVIILGILGVSAVSVGYFSNYIMLVHACQTLFNQIGASFTTSYGNYAAKIENEDSRFSYYLKSRFFMSWVAIVFSNLYLCLIQPFIALFFGQSYLLSTIIAVLLTFHVFIVLSSSINLSTQNATGTHNIDSVFMIIQAFVGIILSVVLGYFFGIVGVVLGMVVSIFVFTGIIKGCKVVKKVFNKKWYIHILIFIKELFSFGVVSLSSFALYYFVLKPRGVLLFIVMALVAFLVANILLVLINIKSKNLSFVKERFLRIFSKKNNKENNA